MGEKMIDKRGYVPVSITKKPNQQTGYVPPSIPKTPKPPSNPVKTRNK